MIQQPWRYAAPVLDVALLRHPVHYTTPRAGVYGPPAPAFAALAEGAPRSAWRDDEIAAHRARMRTALAWSGGGQGVTPPRVVRLAQEVARETGARPRVTVDAGAHMFSTTAFWECEEPRDLLISNGLASMAFALPAGIAAALHDPARGAIAFTGDGGLMMCAGELANAAEAGARLVTAVFKDAALSLIDIKQQQRQMAPEGVRWARADLAKAAEGFGVRGFRAVDEGGYRAALRAALAHDGPSLIDVQVDPAGYLAQLQAMRG
jgi:acetolactate synthase-1/2/3 large subunit